MSLRVKVRAPNLGPCPQTIEVWALRSHMVSSGYTRIPDWGPCQGPFGFVSRTRGQNYDVGLDDYPYGVSKKLWGLCWECL